MGRTGTPSPVVAAGGALLLSLGLVGCARSVSAQDVQDSIVEQAERRGWDLDSVDCPAGLPPDVGVEIICAVEVSGEVEARPGEFGVVDRFRVVVRGIDRGAPRYGMYPLIEGTM